MDFSLRKTKKWHGSARHKPEKLIKIYVRKIYDDVRVNEKYRGTLFCIYVHHIMIHELLHMILWDFRIKEVSTSNEDLVAYLTNELCEQELSFRNEGFLPFPLRLLDLLKHDLGSDFERNLVFKS